VKKILITVLALAVAGMAARIRYAGECAELRRQLAAISESWNAVDSALRDHAELLPALAGKVDVPEKLKSRTQQTITEARAVLEQPGPARDKIQAYSKLSLESSRLLLAAEQNTALRADPTFLLLKEQLTDTDNHVMVARRRYNEALERYNASLAVFPRNVVAAIGGFSRNDAYFSTGVESQAPAKERP
jgi:LemA protein